MRESTIEKAVVGFAKEQGILTWKIQGPGDRGKPDRALMLDGKIVFMELKAPGKKPTALQHKTLQKLRDYGFEAEWFDNAPKAIAWLKSTLLAS